MCQFEPVTESLRSVRRDDGTPTGVMVFTPIRKIGSHTVASGATGSKTEGTEEYGVVIDGEMVEGHRSKTPISPSQLQVDEKGGLVLLGGKQVARLRLA